MSARTLLGFATLWLATSLTAFAQSPPADDPRPVVKPGLELEMQKQLQEGEALFERDWLKRGGFARSRGNGLGPMFNAASCLACHKEGAPGGAGKNEFNVDLLSLDIGPREKLSKNFQERAERIHPAFSATSTTAIVHRHRANVRQAHPTVDSLYEDWRDDLIWGGSIVPLSLNTPQARREGLTVILSQRNTPALFGAGLIDAIPETDIRDIAQWQATHNRATVGRIPVDGRGRVGRFGWRGQISRLHDFVLGACAVELGLTVPGQFEPIDIIKEQDKPARLDVVIGTRGEVIWSSEPALDLTESQCLALTSYVASLPAPARAPSKTEEHARDVSNGEALFEVVGCVDCHRRRVGDVDGLYSDLLLHDMGPELSDPVGASAPYYGSPPPDTSSPSLVRNPVSPGTLRQDWRTPPLWGVADSAPYLHDGRAATLDEAIRRHGGQGRASASRYTNLQRADRERVLAFLESLKAPTVERVVLPANGKTPVKSPLKLAGSDG